MYLYSAKCFCLKLWRFSPFSSVLSICGVCSWLNLGCTVISHTQFGLNHPWSGVNVICLSVSCHTISACSFREPPATSTATYKEHACTYKKARKASIALLDKEPKSEKAPAS